MVGELPPGPPLPLALQTVLAWSPRGDDVLAFCHRRYGDVFTVRAFPTGTMVFVADPAVVKDVFTGSPAIFHAGEGNDVLEPVLGPRSVLLLDESPHLWRRKLMLPMFHGEAVRQYAEIVDEVAEGEIDRWPIGQRFALHPRMRALTFEVILRAVIGVAGEERLAHFRKTMPSLAAVDNTVMWMWLWPALARVGPWRRYARAQAEANGLLREEIAARRRDPKLTGRRDILSLLVQARDEDGQPLGEEDLRDQLVTLLLAGHETTATALAWAFECLIRSPGVLERARAAAIAGDDQYLDAVAQETLRLRPVVPSIARRLTQPTRVAGYELPAGVVVAPAIGLIHHSEDLYPAAGEFRPERFLDQPVPQYAWIPFGGGTRRCLGAAFAQQEMRLVLRAVLRRVELRPGRRRPERPRTYNIFSVPSRGAEVVCVRRAGRVLTPRDGAQDVWSGLAMAHRTRVQASRSP